MEADQKRRDDERAKKPNDKYEPVEYRVMKLQVCIYVYFLLHLVFLLEK